MDHAVEEARVRLGSTFNVDVAEISRRLLASSNVDTAEISGRLLPSVMKGVDTGAFVTPALKGIDMSGVMASVIQDIDTSAWMRSAQLEINIGEILRSRYTRTSSSPPATRGEMTEAEDSVSTAVVESDLEIVFGAFCAALIVWAVREHTQDLVVAIVREATFDVLFAIRLVHGWMRSSDAVGMVVDAYTLTTIVRDAALLVRKIRSRGDPPEP
ncbi:MAG: hypothetical protein JWN62_3670 [Acidimicrobiales bacterium]|nr:hypothetical protein [Acidimicrobiales bacterium]